MYLDIPVQVGDTVYALTDRFVEYEPEKELAYTSVLGYHKTGEYHIIVGEFQVVSISISCNKKGEWTKKFRLSEKFKDIINDEDYRTSNENFTFDSVGKFVFTDMSEAMYNYSKLETKIFDNYYDCYKYLKEKI